MSDPKAGLVSWTDLTVADAEQVRDFYKAVVGWSVTPVDMGGYNDYEMCSPHTGRPVAGICHSKGGNAKIPPQWMLYVTVQNMQKSLRLCEELGGKIITRLGEKYCVIQDPAGAVMMICQG